MRTIALFLLLTPVIAMAQTNRLQTFPLTAVRLGENIFKQAQQTDLQYMLALEPDRLLAPYLREAGIPPKAAGYGNWEGSGLDGHIGGHYLSALALMYASTGNVELRQRLHYMISWLDSCQQKNEDGYVGGIPGGKAMWQDIARGNIEAGNFSLNKKWVPWYNLHKLYAGLLDAYQVAGIESAKEILIKLSDWCVRLTANLTDEQMQQMLRCEHGGMNEVFAAVAGITGDKKYLQLARRFSDRRILDPLLQQKDSLTGLHANTQIPKVVGYLRAGELTGEKDWIKAADFFWQTVVKNRTVSIGGNSVREHFHPVNDFSSMLDSREGPETCNSYNMLRLTKYLFLLQASGHYMDYYERTLYNHILSSQHPEGGFVYFTPMRPRHYRVYSQPDKGFWCCVGSGLENHSKYGELIYAHNGSDIFINLFIASQLKWEEKGMELAQHTRFPFEETDTITLKLKNASHFRLYLRKPSWVRKGAMRIAVNGKAVNNVPGTNGYIAIERTWKSGDQVIVQLPMQTTTEPLPDGSPWISFVHGPLVLAAVTDTGGLRGLHADDSRMGHIAGGPLYSAEEAPVIVSSGKNIADMVQPVKGRPLTFTVPSPVFPKQYASLQLEPFFRIHDARYMLYWPVSTPEQLEKRNEEMRQRGQARLALEARTVDQVAPGEQQPESDHHFLGERTEAGVYRNRHWRHAAGWFSYDLKNTTKDARILRITYFGGDKNRHFDIFINNELLQAVHLDGSAGDQFIDVDYPLPEELVKDPAAQLTIKFAAHSGSLAGSIYYVRLLR